MPGVPDKPSARGHVGTRTNQGSRNDYITEKPYLHHQLGVLRAPFFGLVAAISGHWLRLACSIQVDWLVSNPLVFGHLRLRIKSGFFTGTGCKTDLT